ncbi:hypothetical protein GTY65_09725 [Streptomyces sp. SID8379]|uniref:DUF7010 family protein n=1 Tax=unclassified Streptomyces TaxID=2593676 RepID=UPI0003784C45|nr:MULTISPECIES: hypothetical protein [unclassified Streptomyces]MYW64349.1 hypothetical protein [Streptomyces sp. SID8379]
MTSAALPPPSPAGASECLALTRTLRRRGTVVLSVFALVWAFAGASGTGPADGAVPLATEAVAVLLTVAALFLGLRKGAAPSPRTVNLPANWARGVGIINGLEVLAIFAVIAAANASGRPGLVPVGIALVVGLHFFPLARLYDQGQYRWTAALLCAVAVAGLLLYAAGGADTTVRVVVGLGAAVVLWVSAFHLALRG